MADAFKKVQEFINGFVGVLIAFLVMLVFANMVFDTGFDPINGIIGFLNQFLNNGFAGLLALVVFVWFFNK